MRPFRSGGESLRRARQLLCGGALSDRGLSQFAIRRIIHRRSSVCILRRRRSGGTNMFRPG